jgi:2-oxoglutarate dehydrogenase E2 component (dihydrolipoamide succinyltransferase)
VRGGTFTISNHGVSGSLIATPIIINQPQSAILGVGKIEKRIKIREIDGEDVMAIRPMCYVSLTIDHRVVDGFQTNAFLTELVSTLENWS